MVKLLFYKVKNIIIGSYRNITGYVSDELRRRLDICNKCEHKVKYMGSYICNQCGCILKSKASVEAEKCLMNKW